MCASKAKIPLSLQTFTLYVAQALSLLEKSKKQGFILHKTVAFLGCGSLLVVLGRKLVLAHILCQLFGITQKVV
jgi:hypothetical protein